MGRKGTVFQLLADISKALTPKELLDALFASLLMRRVVPPEGRALLMMPEGCKRSILPSDAAVPSVGSATIEVKGAKTTTTSGNARERRLCKSTVQPASR